MSKFLPAITLLLLLSPYRNYAQVETIDTAIIARIREEGLHHSQVNYIAENITDISGPRLTNSPGFRRAGQWAVATLKQWGLSNAQLEPWGEFGYGWTVDHSYLALKSPYYEPLIGYALPWSGSTDGMQTASVFLLEHADSASIEKMVGNIKGKIVLTKTTDTSLMSAFKAFAIRHTESDLLNLRDEYMITNEMLRFFMPQLQKLKQQYNMLVQKGALAILTMTGGRDGTVYVDGFGGYKTSDPPAIPRLAISKEAYLKIERLISSGLDVQLELNMKTTLYKDDLKGYNVVADIPGADPSLKEQLVMVGGHLDSWASATGATDNGAGCIVMMEAVRILKSLGIRPKRTVRIALWSGEEQGLLGSFHYVKNHFGDPATMQLKPETQNVSVYFNLDNGTGKIRGIFDQGNNQVDTIFKQWFKSFADLGATTVTRHNTGSTDHLSFDAVGIPAFQFIQDPIEYETRTHHSNMDTYDHLIFEDLKQAATIVAAIIYDASMRKDKLPRKPLPKPQKFVFEAFADMP